MSEIYRKYISELHIDMEARLNNLEKQITQYSFYNNLLITQYNKLDDDGKLEFPRANEILEEYETKSYHYNSFYIYAKTEWEDVIIEESVMKVIKEVSNLRVEISRLVFDIGVYINNQIDDL